MKPILTNAEIFSIIGLIAVFVFLRLILTRGLMSEDKELPRRERRLIKQHAVKLILVLLAIAGAAVALLTRSSWR